MIRTSVYIDGFNLYGGCLKDSPPGYRWLDLKSMIQAVIRPEHQVNAIHYYTALVRPDGNQDRGPQHQKLYIKALKAHIPELSAHYGQFTIHKARARPVDPTLGPLVNIWKIEEKGSDVNLSAHLVTDAFLDRYDCAVLVCNDGDMAEAAKIVREHTNKKVGVILPIHHPLPNRRKRPASKQLVKNCDFRRELRLSTLSKCQMPSPIPGTQLHKPPNW